MEFKLAPSVFGADFGHLKEQLNELEQAGVEYLHVDVMDGHFVEKMAFGPDHVKALRKMTTLPLDVHLMVEKPERILDAILKAGADIVTVHQESTTRLYSCLEKIKANGAKAGAVLSPATSEKTLECILDQVDMILLMTINPGQDNQQFHPEILKKITRTRNMLEGRNVDIEVDGGIDNTNIRLCKEAGANVFVCGRYTFKENVTEKIGILRKEIQK